MATLRNKLREELRGRIQRHADLSVREIVDVPEVRELLEVLYPIRIAANLWYRQVVRSAVMEMTAEDGTRTWVSVEQPPLDLPDVAETDEIPVVTAERRYVPAIEARDDSFLRSSALHDLHKRILGLVRRSPVLDGTLKARLLEQIDAIFEQAA